MERRTHQSEPNAPPNSRTKRIGTRTVYRERQRAARAYVRIVVVAVVPERLARIVYSPFGAVPPKPP